MRIVVSGASGFIGTKLCERLVAGGHEVTALTRDASRSRDHLHPRVKVVSWAEGASWEHVVDGANGIVNLAGESIAQRWTAKAKDRILKSRLSALDRLRAAVEKAEKKPEVLVSASAAGYYGPHGAEELTEASPPGDDFLARVCVAWEEAARRFAPLGVRVVCVRTGLVLGREALALKRMSIPFLLFGGGPVGSGAQWVSWVHLDDLADLYVYALENASVEGAMNGTAPAPVPNRDLSRALGNALHRPSWIPVPAFAMRTALGEMSAVLLDGQRVVPARTTSLGFRFRHAEVGEALRDIYG
jgi:uncharacterized protein (TIGR01777 family)